MMLGRQERVRRALEEFVLLASGLGLLITLRIYVHDVAAALASTTHGRADGMPAAPTPESDGARRGP